MVDRLVRTAVNAAITLFVTLQPLGADRHGAFNRLFGDGTAAAGAGEGYGLADEQLFDPGQLHVPLRMTARKGAIVPHRRGGGAFP